MGDEQSTLTQDKSTSPGHQLGFLIGRASQTWLLFRPSVQVCSASVWSWNAPGVVPSPAVWSWNPRHCNISSDRGKQPHSDIRPIARPPSPPQTELIADGRGSARPQGLTRGWVLALTTWPTHEVTSWQTQN